MNKLLIRHHTKASSFILGIFLAAVLLPFGPTVSISVVCAFAIFKEIYDLTTKGSVSVTDTLSAILGGFMVIILYLL